VRRQLVRRAAGCPAARSRRRRSAPRLPRALGSWNAAATARAWCPPRLNLDKRDVPPLSRAAYDPNAARLRQSTARSTWRGTLLRPRRRGSARALLVRLTRLVTREQGEDLAPGVCNGVRRRAPVAPALPCLRLRLKERFRLEGWEAAGREELSQGLAEARRRNSAEGRRPSEDPPRSRPQCDRRNYRPRTAAAERAPGVRTPGAAATAAATAVAAASGIATGSARRSAVASARASVTPRPVELPLPRPPPRLRHVLYVPVFHVLPKTSVGSGVHVLGVGSASGRWRVLPRTPSCYSPPRRPTRPLPRLSFTCSSFTCRPKAALRAVL